MNRADQKDHLIFCRQWAWDNMPYGMDFMASDLRRSYQDEVGRRGTEDYPSQSAFIIRLNTYDFLASKIETRQLKSECGSDRWRVKKDGSGKPDYTRPLMGGVKVYSKIEVVAQDAATCKFQGIRVIVGRVCSWIQSYR